MISNPQTLPVLPDSSSANPAGWGYNLFLLPQQ
jgi:hypothetical protein